MKSKYEAALANSKDWREKLQEVVARQKEKAEKEAELRNENEKLIFQYSQILKELQDEGDKRKKLEKELAVLKENLLKKSMSVEVAKPMLVSEEYGSKGVRVDDLPLQSRAVFQDKTSMLNANINS